MQPSAQFLTLLLLLTLGACSQAPQHAADLARVYQLQWQRSGDAALLKTFMAHGAPRVRQQAARALGGLRSPAAVAPLVRACHDLDPQVAREALFQLGLQPGPDRSTQLRRFLDAEDPAVNARALASLRPSDLRSHELTTALLMHDDPAVQGQAALALARLPGLRQPAHARRLLTHLFSSSNHSLLRLRVSFALSQLASEELRGLLETNCRQEELPALLRQQACDGLARLPSAATSQAALLVALAAQDFRVCAAAAQALRGHPPAERARYQGLRVQRAIQELARHPSRRRRRLGLSLLPCWPRAELAPLRKALGGDDPVLRRTALRALCQAETADILDLCAEALRDQDPRLRACCAEALPGLPPSERRDQLLRVCLSSKEPALLNAVARGCVAHPAVELGTQLAASFYRAPAAARPALLRGMLAADVAPDHASLLRLRQDPQWALRCLAHRALGRSSWPEPTQLAPAPRPGPDFAWGFLHSQPRYEIRTNRGRMQIILYPESAPRRCLEFMALARAGRWQGLRLDEAAEGGPLHFPLATGPAPRLLPDEINSVPCLPGMLYAPAQPERDASTAAFLITRRHRPDLDRRCTVFGSVTAGVDVLMRSEIGDRVLAISRLHP